jgi:hypothetical protein
MRRLVISCLAAGLLLAGTGCTGHQGPSTAGAAATSAKADTKQIGKTMTVTDDEDSADITLVSVGTTKEGTTPGLKPDSGTYVVLNLKIVGKAGKFSTNSLYVRLKTAAGKTVKATDGTAALNAVEPDLKLQDLGPGETATGNVLIDAPLEPGTKMVWTDALDKELASWDL